MAFSRRLTVCLGSAVIALLATACSDGASSESDDSARPSVPQKSVSPVPGVKKSSPRSDTVGLTLPIDAYDLSADQIAQTGEALNMLTTQCVARFGIASKALPKSVVNEGSPHVRRYGTPESEQVATRYGFHMPEGDPRAITPDKMVRQPAEVVEVTRGMKQDGSPLTEFHGTAVPKGGCAGEAERKLNGDGKRRTGHAETASAIKARSFEVSMQDPRVIKAQKQWATCMAGKGYNTYKTSLAAAGDARWNGAHATSAEIATAKASWACAKGADLVGTWVSVETAFQNDQIEKNAETLKEEQTALAEEGRRVSEIVAESGAGAS
ncbi:hypothetical protein [Streptomyces sp. NPDC005780]|uniref:hypothetical protein n=1 Tax=Streptomyces sp. NPDC005780 TaxID=3364730 RepID=UPI0036B3B08E